MHGAGAAAAADEEPVAKAARRRWPTESQYPAQPLNAPLPYKKGEWHMDDRVQYDEVRNMPTPELPKREDWDCYYVPDS